MTLETKNFGNFQNSLILSLLLDPSRVPHALKLEIKCFEKALVRRLLYIWLVSKVKHLCKAKVKHLYRGQGETLVQRTTTITLNPYKNPIHPENNRYEVLPYKENEEKSSK